MSLPRLFLPAVLGLVLFPSSATGARFTYHGDLMDGDAPAQGRYQLRLRALAAHDATVAISPATELPSVDVVEGRFSVEVDLPEADGPITWVEVSVRGSEGDYEVLGDPLPVSKVNGACPGAWALDGNSGVPVGSFLGLADPADSRPLQLHVKGARVAEFAPASVNDYGNAPSVALGSSNNVASAAGATVGGGGSTLSTPNSPPCPGCRNAATAAFATVAGGRSNLAGDGAAAIGGGTANTAAGLFNTIAGGTGNLADGVAGASIGGGSNNQASGLNSTVAGGSDNLAGGSEAFVGGGEENRAEGTYASVLGGRGNIATGRGATVAGGVENVAAGINGFAAGFASCAGGDYSVALGHMARTRNGGQAEDGSCGGFENSGDANGDAGSFVFADGQAAIFRSTGDNQFLVRASAGVAINTPPPPNGAIELTVQTDADDTDYANLWLRQRTVNQNGILISVGDGAGSNNAGFYIDHYNGTAQARRLELAPNGAVAIRSNVTQANTGVTMAANAGSWSSLSDRRLKTAIAPIDTGAVLDRLMAMPLTSWSYIAQGTTVRHVGPMAQDFAAAFGLGENDTTISTIDADGIALAAIQGLNRRLTTENADLRARLEALEARFAAMEPGAGVAK